MEKSQIFLFTSDYNEGWGAVLNEAMNSGCAVVASHACGGVPFLVKQGVNGFVYEFGNTEQLTAITKTLLEDRRLCKEMGNKAISTIKDEWNAGSAAKKLIRFCGILLKERHPVPEKNDILSRAKTVTQQKMYRYIEE